MREKLSLLLGEQERRVRTFIDGRDFGEEGPIVDMIDPASGRRWASAVLAPGAADAAVASSARAFADGAWSQLAGWQRAAVLRALADLIPAHAEELGLLETLANGKALRTTRAEIGALTRWYHFFASAAELADGNVRPLTATARAQILEQPLGVVVAITPFNGSVSLGSWKLAPALAAGNAVVLKPPPTTAASSVRLAQLAIEAGLPPGILNVVVGDGPTGERLAADPRVSGVSFTGSTAVAERLGALVAGRLTSFVCEAGGKSAHIVFDDADLQSALTAARQGAFSATGQTCVAGSRLLVQSGIFDTFAERFAASAQRLRVGDPLDDTTHLGPLASAQHYDRVCGFVDRALAAGATRLTGGKPALGPELDGGYWLEPTVLVDVRADMEICREEVFGPVVTLQRFDDEAEALELANGTRYGLAAGVWTSDAARAQRMAGRLDAGTVWVNCYRVIDWRVPFGGVKASGLGRENGIEAMRGFTQIKAVVSDTGPAADPFPDAT